MRFLFRKVVLLSTWVAMSCYAQAPGGGRPLAPEPREAPKFLTPLPGKIDLDLPEARTLLPKEEKLSSGLAIVVKRFDIIGSTVFPQDTLQAEAAPYLNRSIGSEDLDALRTRLTRLYVNAGYVNSGAIIPDQEVRSGVVTIRIIEGTLGRLEIGGKHDFRESYLQGQLWDDPEQVFQVTVLQERMQLLLQNPQIERINAELAPGDRLGESVLRATVHEAPAHTLGMAYANDRSPSVGPNRLELLGGWRNLLGVADNWLLRLGKTRGVDDITFNGSIPLTANNTSLELLYEQNASQVIEAPFDVLNIESRSRSLQVGLRHPLYRTLEKTMTVGAAIARRESTTYLDGERFSFTPGSPDGESTVAVLRLSADWLDRGEDYVFSVRGVLNQGMDAFNATRNQGDLPDADFRSYLLQTQWVRRLTDAGAVWLLRADLQKAQAPLFPIEKFAVGGMDSVRGYRESQLMRDNGWIASTELRWPITRLAIPGLSTQSGDGQLSAAFFVDIGQAWDDSGKKEKRWGAGPGIRWDMAQNSYAQIYWAAARRDVVEDKNDDLQDRGIHFRVVVQHAF